MAAAHRGAVLAINAQNSPHVAALDEAELQRLLDADARILVAVGGGGEVAGYVIAFERACAYDGEEFLCLRQAIAEDFVYIDQVAVALPYRGSGIGRKLYQAAEAAARSGHRPCLCCEVNERPPNPGSMSFHSALGFTVLRSMETRDGRKVALLTRGR